MYGLGIYSLPDMFHSGVAVPVYDRPSSFPELFVHLIDIKVKAVHLLQAAQVILDRSEVYSGCYARVSLNFYAFNSNGNKGVACGLGNIQKVRDGEPLGGRTNAADDFATLDDYDFLA